VSGEHDAPTAVLEYIVRGLVDEPDEVRVEVEEDGDRLQLNVFVPQSEMGRVIGKRGRTAHAIRTLVRAAAARDGIEVDSIEFVD
jgi:predicted RNA-binding protein YlqC (UPF0109 family)